jgi:hypothetical protein
MANSIISTISRFMTPELIGKLADASGLDRSLTQKSLDAAVPSVLSALTGLVAKPGGARQLSNAVAQQPTDILDSITSGLTGSSLSGDTGTRLLTSLLGGGPFGLLTSTVSKFLGIGEGPMRMVMGIVTPLIMGVLGREQRASGLDASGLARLLTGQKDEIAAAMPAGLGRLLETGNQSESRAYEVPRAAYSSPAQRIRSDMPGRGVNWLYWVLPLLALAGLLWYLLPNERETVPTAITKSAGPTADVLPAKSAYLATAPDGWLSIGSAPNDYVGKDVYNRAADRLGTVKDVLVTPDGKMAAAVINVGRYLGIGDKDIAVPISALQHQSDGDHRIIIDASRDALQAAPAFAQHRP